MKVFLYYEKSEEKQMSLKVSRHNYFNSTFNGINLNILDSGYADLDTSWTNTHMPSPATKPFSRIYYIESGSGTISYADKTVALVPGHMYLIPAYLPIYYQCPDTLQKVYFHLSLTTPNGMDLLAGLSDIYCEKITSKNKINSIRDSFLKASFLDILYLKQTLYSDIHKFLIKNDILKENQIYKSPLVSDALNYINSNLSINLTITELANILGASKSVLASLFKKEIGQNIGQYIDSLVMERANYLLCHNPELSVADISDMLGFCDQFYFSKKFKQKFYESPRSLRKRLTTRSHDTNNL